MNIRVAIVLLGSLLVSAAGGVVAAFPVLNAAEETAVPLDRAPDPDLEDLRGVVLASLWAASNGVANHAEQLELLAGLLAEAGRPAVGESLNASQTPSPARARRDPIHYP